ncbi:threonine/homoserine efflux transporter RhtA [Litoreibacter halocynthiae]|uniref:Threonine/homoserine efflux transporter RhtA n=1 Tax=Litoreibacter halocynthiae TaxID=1242689 RepID=A0A4R7LFS5_9RHOB|nr:DMT family transporter [Litoreibacter halocynthiae]TDT73181.1 threonine/homoserine efflux transporter RhtA [Litoreibacter halocynthiae]
MDFRAILMGLAFALMWSSAFTSARIIVADAPPLYSLSLRFLISGLLGILIAKMLGQTWKLSRAQWRATWIFGICQNALYLGLNFVAMQWIEASLAAIIASTMPLLVALVGWLVFKDRVPLMGMIGLVAGIAGVVLIMGSRISGGVDVLGVVFCLIGAMALTFATLSVKGAASGGNVLMIVGLQMLVGSACLFAVAVPLETWDVTLSPTWIAAFVYTTLVPGLLATWVWFMLVGRVGAVKASTFHFLNPVFGVGIAAVLLGESIGMTDFVGVLIIAGGILAVQLAKQKII